VSADAGLFRKIILQSTALLVAYIFFTALEIREIDKSSILLVFDIDHVSLE
jgi:hypothetical protein